RKVAPVHRAQRGTRPPRSGTMARSAAQIRPSDELPYRVGVHIAGEPRTGRGGTTEREDPADTRRIVTASEDGSIDDGRDTGAAAAAARAVFDGDPARWVANTELRRRVLIDTAALIRANAESLAQMVSLEVGMPMRQARPHVAAAADVFDFYSGFVGKTYGETI